MTNNIDYYIDDNETIYVKDRQLSSGLANGSSSSLLTGLAEIPELSGQSTVFVNHIQFKASGFIDPDGTDFNRSFGEIVCGVVPVNEYVASNAPDDLEAYQTIKGFVLKGCHGYTRLMRPHPAGVGTEWQGYGSDFSWSKSYRPRKALLLSRLQEVCFCFKNYTNSSDVDILLTMTLQLKRGN